MNWGNKLVLVFIGFAALMATLVYKSMNTKFELVSKNYYTDELVYQEKIDGRKNVAAIGKVTFTESADSLSIQLPGNNNGGVVNGEAWFYCSSDASKDRFIPVAVDGNLRQNIPLKKLSKANYRVKLSWQVDSVKYYDEQMIVIQ